MPVASARYAGYAITAEISGEQAYRVSDSLASVRAQIKNGPGPFPCAVLGTIAALPAGTLPDPPPPSAPASAPPADPPAGPGMGRSGAQEPPAGGSEPSGLKVTCTPPAGVKLINGATATVEVVTEKATNALVLPVEAVAGLHGKGKVDVVGPNRTRQTRDVALGLSDGKVVQITSGLTGSETIAVPGPDLPDAQPKPGESGDPSAPR
jgi:hypothetical protein